MDYTVMNGVHKATYTELTDAYVLHLSEANKNTHNSRNTRTTHLLTQSMSHSLSPVAPSL